LKEEAPKIISSPGQHEAYISRLLELQRNANRSAEETETAKLLVVLIADYEAKHVVDMAFDLTAKASSLTGQVNPIVTRSIGKLVRSMNCYYSNLIEGHDTHPRDIDRALRKDLSKQPKQRELQLEAVAHIEVQKAIDEGADDRSEPLSNTYGRWLHYEFRRRLPDAMLWVEDPQRSEAREVAEPGGAHAAHARQAHP
jgi:hypothetical protein